MSETRGPAASGGRTWLLLVLSALALAALLSLGTWQVQRLQWKEGLLAQINERIASDPVPLAEMETIFAQGGDVDYRPVRLNGRFVHSDERHFLATHEGQSGFFVHTPLQLADGRYIFVNRGFVPYDRKDPATRSEGLTEGEVEVTGLARAAPAEKPSWIVPDNDPAKNIFYWKDLATMAATAGMSEGAEVLPFYVDADETPNPGGLPVGGVTLIDLPNNHLQYAITWYGLALGLCGVVAAWLLRSRSRRSSLDR
ncbi:surfeit locus 1 family protein [Mesorhizobium sp. J18]|uniref:SURF1 family protein n=1 Tax=Mesorhizobium sp. J18 TaxID=935263 RepID=UPI00119A001F|nr:SURF1 family protein [Mesorhizobium sp. J18]TWG89653.1 surfeit locus 1 family protein [Mesorhizobium sp. J18]